MDFFINRYFYNLFQNYQNQTLFLSFIVGKIPKDFDNWSIIKAGLYMIVQIY